MLTRKLLGTLSFVAFVSVTVMSASAQEWKKLGTKSVDPKADHDTMYISTKEQYSKIRIEVADAPVRFTRVVIEFGNGQKMTVPLRELIPAGGTSRAVDLPGNRYIQKIDFWYESASLEGKKAKVILYGLRV